MEADKQVVTYSVVMDKLQDREDANRSTMKVHWGNSSASYLESHHLNQEVVIRRGSGEKLTSSTANNNVNNETRS